MQQEISIYKFGDPLFSEQPVFIYGPVGCGKRADLVNMISKKNPNNYHVMCGYGYKHISDTMGGIEMWLSEKYTLILEEFNISENFIEKLVSKKEYATRIFLLANMAIEKDIPNYIKANFKIIHYTEIKELN